MQSNKSELIKKYQTSESFKTQMKEAQKNYQKLTQRLLYSAQSPHKAFITSYKSRKNQQIYLLNGSQEHLSRLSIDQMTLAFISAIPKPVSEYVIVYINDDNGGFSDWRAIFQVMPFEYFLKLDRIYLVYPTFLEKAKRFFAFGMLPKFINSHIHDIDNLQQLSSLLSMDNKQLTTCISNKQKQESPNPLPPAPACTAKKQKLTIRKYEINEYDKTENGLPELFQILVYYFQEHPKGLEEEGIFRKSANVLQESQAMDRLRNKHFKCLEQIENPHIVANLIKKFLADLQTPLIPYPIFHYLMENENLTPQVLSIQMKQLSETNLTKVLTLMFLLQFLLTSVVPKSTINKMTADNLAICFAPCIMWAQEVSVKDIAYAMKSVKVLALMLRNFQDVFGDRNYQKKLYRLSYNEYKSKSIQAMLLQSQKKAEPLDPNIQQASSLNPLGPTQQKPRKRGIFSSKMPQNIWPNQNPNISPN